MGDAAGPRAPGRADGGAGQGASHLGDSHVIIAALVKFFDEAGHGTWAGRSVPAGGRLAARLAAGARALRGLCHLAAAGTAPATSLCGAFPTSRRHYVPIALPAGDVARTARALRAGITDLLVAVVAEALGWLLRARGEETADQVLRIAVPRARPAAAGGVAG